MVSRRPACCVLRTAGKPLFDGQSEFEQLDKIIGVMGTPNEEVWPGIRQLPNWGKVRRAWWAARQAGRQAVARHPHPHGHACARVRVHGWVGVGRGCGCVCCTPVKQRP